MGAALFLLLFVLMFLGIPIAFALIISSAAVMAIFDFGDLVVVAQRMVRGLDSFSVLACPLFILAGYIMEEGNMSQRLIDWVNCLFGHRKGSVGTVALITCAIFAALTGSGPATVAAIGAIMYPALVQSGYPKGTASGLLAAGGALGPIIPPSIPMIIYCTTMGLNITDMFLGAVTPGLLIMAAFILTNRIMSNRWGVQATQNTYTVREKLRFTWKALGTLFMPILVLGGIYSGIFTATEASAVAVVYGFIVCCFYRTMSWKKLVSILKRSAETSAVGLLIVGAANLFVWILASAQIPTKITAFLVPILNNHVIYLLVLLAILFVVGCLMETIASISILAPILVPTGIALGINELHLGLVFVIALVVGFITPPFGVNLFTIGSITKQRFTVVVRGVVPFIVAAITAVLVIAFVPPITQWLPELVHMLKR